MMKETRRIALIGLAALEAIGIRSIVRECSDFMVEAFGNFADFMPLADSYEAYVADSGTFVANLDFFMPRRQNTIVTGISVMSLKNSSGGPLIIGHDADEADIEVTVKKLLGSLQTGETVPGELSFREREVLRLIAAGRINKEIADELCISVNTVISHRKNISSKLGIKSASGLSLYAVMNGII